MRMHKVMAAGMIGVLALTYPLMAGQPQGQRRAREGGILETQPAEQDPYGLEAPVSIQFRGGTLAEYIRMVEGAARSPAEFNIVVSGPADEVALDPIGLRFVDVETALQVGVNVSRTSPSGDAEPRLRSTLSTIHGEGAPVYHVAVQRGVPMTSRPRQETEVMLLRDLLQAEMKPQTVLSAVEAALVADAEASEPVLRFHEPSSLLIVRGTAPQVATVRQVVEQLGRAAAADQRARELREIEPRLEQLRSDLQALEAQYHVAQNERMQRLGTRRVERGETDEERAARQQALGQAEAQFAALSNERASLQRTLAEVENRRRELMGSGGAFARVRELEAEVARLRAEIAELKARQTPAAR